MRPMNHITRIDTRTASSAQSWSSFFLSKNPQVQQRVKEELREHHLLITVDRRKIVFSDLLRMRYKRSLNGFFIILFIDIGLSF